jgi:ferredoxin-NADP reductase
MEVSANRINQAGFWDELPPRWDSETEEELVCCAITDETHDVKTFTFRTPSGSLFHYAPGQFLTLELEIDGTPINRCYTIASAPTRPHTVSITVKRHPTGPVSNWLHDHLKVGERVRVLPPAGEFTCANFPAKKYLFMSAGSGITPLMSMVRTHVDLADDRDIVFLHSARTPDDIIFENELQGIAYSRQNFRTYFICEKIGMRRDWNGVTGFLSLGLLQLSTPDFLEREVFICGPEPYMKSVEGMLTDAGFPMDHFHLESFSFETLQETQAAEEAAELEQAEEAAAAPDIQMYSVQFQRSRREITCVSTQSVLDAARQASVRLPSSCTQGMCGTCKAKLISGQVHMEHKGGIRQREIDQGYVLLCCSRPLSDLVVDK